MTGYLPLQRDTGGSQWGGGGTEGARERWRATLTRVQSEALHREEETATELIEGGGP